jgi:hypothetical protein
MKTGKVKEILFRIWRFLGKGKSKGSGDLQSSLELADSSLLNENPHLKIAQIYQKKGQGQKAFQEYLTAAELFCDVGQYHEGIAIYKKLLRKGFRVDLVRVKLTAAYERMELKDQTLNQRQMICSSHKSMEMKDTGQKNRDSMDKSSSHISTLNEKYNLNTDLKDRDRIGEATLIHPPESKISRFFDLAKVLEEKGSLELGEIKSITIEEILEPG